MSPAPGVAGTSNATRTSQIFCARGAFVTEYPTEVLEIGIRSNVGIQVRGLTNTIEGFYLQQYRCNGVPRTPAFGSVSLELPPTSTIAFWQYTAGIVQTSEERYSFFRLSYRIAGTTDAYIKFSNIFGIKSETSQPVYNYIRLEMPESKRYGFD